MTTWIHIIADLYDCDFTFWISKNNIDYISQFFYDKILKYDLTILDFTKHEFSKDSFSLIYMLAESHISIHTWPEINYISLDIFVCNYSLEWYLIKILSANSRNVYSPKSN